jgi:predicted phage terminase large subunit-like protein
MPPRAAQAPLPLSSPLAGISLADIPKILPQLSLDEQAQLLAELDQLTRLRTKEQASKHFMPFVRAMWPTFIEGRHHLKMADAFERVANGTLKRLIICMPPRHTKSEFGSYLLPAWFLGRYPDKKVIQSSNTAELAVGFGRKVRNLVDTDTYQSVFDTTLQADSKAAGRWNTSKDGEYFAIGVGGTVTGKGADLFIIDDPHSEQQAKLAESDPAIYDGVYNWYTSGPRQRLQPGGAIVIIMTRWSKRDLVGQVLRAAAQRGLMPELDEDGEEDPNFFNPDEWEVIEFPAILPSGNPLWPEFWPLPELEALKRELPHSKWSSQYQQNPVAEESAIIKREWWQKWERDKPPRCEFILHSWDTAFEKHERADYSALTCWGIFYREDDETGLRNANLILLNAVRDRVEFPELKRLVLKQYQHWEPDSIIVEKKASGAPLIYELRSMGIPVQEFTPTRATGDKIARLNAVADIFASKRIWAPATHWAEEVIQEVIDFPAGVHDDYVDSTVMALLRFRQGGFIGTSMDEVEDEQPYQRRRNRGYY